MAQMGSESRVDRPAGGCPYSSYPSSAWQDGAGALEPVPSGYDLLLALAKRWWAILLFTLLGSVAAGVYAFKATPVYRAQTVIAPPEQRKSGAASAALAALGGFGAEIAGSLGLAVGGADANRLEALLTSHRLAERVVAKYDLLPVLFPKLWDPAAKRWKLEAGEPAPNVWSAEKVLKRIYGVRNDPKTGMLTVSVEHSDPKTALSMLQAFLRELASLMQEDELAKVASNEKFLNGELRRSSDPITTAKLQALLSDQLERAMMVRNLQHVAYESVDPPAASDRKVKPKRALIVALGFTVSCFAGVLLALAAEWMEKARAVTR